MTKWWTNDRDTLAEGLHYHCDGNPCVFPEHVADAQRLIDSGVVRVLDPDDTVQRGRVAKRLREIEVQAVAGIHRDATDWAAAQLIEALRQP
jgi:hypothetical protein